MYVKFCKSKARAVCNITSTSLRFFTWHQIDVLSSAVVAKVVCIVYLYVAGQILARTCANVCGKFPLPVKNEIKK